MIRYSFDAEYENQLYFKPKEVLELVEEKIQIDKLGYWLFLPIRFFFFCIVMLTSIVLYPLHLINKLFFLLNIVPETLEIDNRFLEILLCVLLLPVPYFLNFIYLVTYHVFFILSLIFYVLQMIYQLIPPRTYYFVVR